MLLRSIILFITLCFACNYGSDVCQLDKIAETDIAFDCTLDGEKTYQNNSKLKNPIKKIYLKKEDDKYFFCVDFIDDISFTPRIHLLPNGAKVLLSFNEDVDAPKTKNINHSLIKGYFFEKFGESSLMMVLALKENVVFIEKVYTPNTIKIGFRINKKRIIAIDAGHGGKDPGTQCLNGDFEKNITLVMAIELRETLIKSGKYKVILTRDNDSFLSIDDRKKKIDPTKTDLLISLHTDSNNDKNIRGISIYTLPNLDYLTKLSEKYADNASGYYKILAKSRKFSHILAGYIPNMCKISNRPCRNVELKILKVDLPAILLELGCVTNKTDNSLLHSKDFRDKANRAILYALNDFFEKEEKK
ncbi:MAG: N-acetylmuramoyl-L-alanine amidase [Holosporaceae bacterium]|jgi:N-acetylmuramoyl-L-alanine amidase|nr:N-acetylmuramoyl-L-alanine amidase [Holosporaceae bacterium]